MTRARPVLPAILVVLAAFAAGTADAGGLDVHRDVGAQELGLPLYPGAVQRKDDDGSADSFSFGLWGAAFGVKLVVAAYHSSDDVATVSAFYRKALRRYGEVLDCTVAPPSAAASGTGKGGTDFDFKSRTPVTCGNDSVASGGRLFKVGTNADQHVFKATPEKTGTRFELMWIAGHGSDRP